MYYDDVFVRNFIPCYRKSDNVIGLYDLVNDVFYTNNGTGIFLKGADVVPTPSEPIEIESVGDKTNQLFDKDSTPFIVSKYISAIEIGQEPIYTGNNSYKIWAIDLEPNKTYTVSNTKTKVTCWAVVDENNIVLDGNKNSELYTFTASANAKKLLMSVCISGANKCDDIIMANEGSTAIDYEPYGYKIPVETKGKNLFDYNNQNWSVGILLPSNGTLNTENTNYKTTDYIDILEPNKIYSIGFNQNFATTSGTSNRIIFYDVNKNFIISEPDATAQYMNIQRYTRTITVPANTKYIRYSIRISDTDIQIEEGTPTEYKPYFNQITNIYLKEPLRKIGNYADYIDFKNKKVVRNIGEIYFNSKNWAYHSSGFFYFSDSNYTIDQGLSNYFPKSSAIYPYFRVVAGGVIRLYDMSYFGNLTTFNSWIASHSNASLILPRSTPIEESITLPSILTAKGDCIIDVDTKIKPNNVWLKYIKR